MSGLFRLNAKITSGFYDFMSLRKHLGHLNLFLPWIILYFFNQQTIARPLGRRQFEIPVKRIRAQKVQLAVPRSIHDSYRPSQQGELMDLKGFIELVREREA
jgi:hypothetical protein